MRGPGLLVEFADVKNRLVESGKDEGKEEQRGMDLKCVGFFFFLTLSQTKNVGISRPNS